MKKLSLRADLSTRMLTKYCHFALSFVSLTVSGGKEVSLLLRGVRTLSDGFGVTGWLFVWSYGI